ncbi:hypothetical protein B296_00015485, partial [Ensete ventricosum]
MDMHINSILAADTLQHRKLKTFKRRYIDMADANSPWKEPMTLSSAKLLQYLFIVWTMCRGEAISADVFPTGQDEPFKVRTPIQTNK